MADTAKIIWEVSILQSSQNLTINSLLIYMLCSNPERETVFFNWQNNFKFATCTKLANQQRIGRHNLDQLKKLWIYLVLFSCNFREKICNSDHTETVRRVKNDEMTSSLPRHLCGGLVDHLEWKFSFLLGGVYEHRLSFNSHIGVDQQLLYCR